MINIRKLEAELGELADLLRQGSKLTSSQYCMPVLALLFLRYAYSHYKMVVAEILENRPRRGGRVIPMEPSGFAAKSALYLPKEAQFEYLVKEEKNYSLTPGAYVVVAEQEDDGVDFHERMNEIHAELAKLNQEANVLMEEIQKVWEELK